MDVLSLTQACGVLSIKLVERVPLPFFSPLEMSVVISRGEADGQVHKGKPWRTEMFGRHKW